MSMAAKNRPTSQRTQPASVRTAQRFYDSQGGQSNGWPILALAFVCGMALGFSLLASRDLLAPAPSVRVTQVSPEPLMAQPAAKASDPSPSNTPPPITPPVTTLPITTQPATAPDPSPPTRSPVTTLPITTQPVTAPDPSPATKLPVTTLPITTQPITIQPVTAPSAIAESAPPSIVEPASRAPLVIPVSPSPRQSAALPPEPATPRGEEGRRPDAARLIVPPLVQPSTDLPAWRRYAVAAPNPAGRPMVAVVIDDMGLNTRRSGEVAALPGPLTLAFLPYGHNLPRQTEAARDRGHELLVHVSMQPQGASYNPGPNALTIDLPPEEIKRRLGWALAAFGGYVGINNHMGSRFTVDRTGMAVVMAELKARGLLFLDSRTVQHSVGSSIAAADDVPHAARHVFLDNEQSAGEVTHRLAELERIAQRTGMAIAIGHPHDVTIAALRSWLPTLADKGLVLVPVSAIVAKLESRRGEAQSSVMP